MLETIKLPGLGRRTTRLGFGGSGLMGGLSQRESLALLETAYEAGIRHFDVAPSYGHGQAERCLGLFLRGKHDEVTLTTKYGILPPSRSSALGVARSVLRPVVRRLPSVRKRVARAAAGLAAKANFSADEAQRSLESSLRKMGVERIDLWLLHEPSADDLDRTDLLPFLQQVQQRGQIGMFGIGADRAQLQKIWSQHRSYCSLLQLEWSAAIEDVNQFPGAFLIHHRSVLNSLPAIVSRFQEKPGMCQRWSDAVDADLSDRQVLAGVLLQAALIQYPNGIVLFSSRRPEHILANVLAAEESQSTARGRQFLQLMGRDCERIEDQPC